MALPAPERFGQHSASMQLRSMLALIGAHAAYASLLLSAHGAELLEVELVPKAQAGHGQPGLTVRANGRIDVVRLEVRRSLDGRVLKQKAGPLGAGEGHTFALPLERPGEARFIGRLEVEAKSERGAMPIDVTARLLAPLTLEVDRAEVHLGRQTLRLKASRPLEKVHISVLSDTGDPLGETEAPVEVDEDGWVFLHWEQAPGRVLRISVRGMDADGFFGGVDLYPWRVDIPHEDIEFASGQVVIRPGETPKLEASLAELKAALAKYGRLAKGITLYIAGHTDTVGDAASNQALSERRARAIGAWFRKRGIPVPIRYAGLGESRLLVLTPDEKDEPKNRRAEYIVAIDPPQVGGVSRWRSL